jgi:hypothetical protein
MITTIEDIAPWQRCLRDGFLPLIETQALVLLRDALEQDDPRIRQGATTSPAPFPVAHGDACLAACPLGFVGMAGEGVTTVGEVEQFFADLCEAADRRLGYRGACAVLLNHIDLTPRDEMRAGMVAEIGRELVFRGAA